MLLRPGTASPWVASSRGCKAKDLAIKAKANNFGFNKAKA